MDTHKKSPLDQPALDDDVVEMLLENTPTVNVPETISARIKKRFMDQVQEDEQATGPGFETIRANEGEWLDVLPGGSIKILHQDTDSEVITYLAKLSPGFEMPSHDHTHDEECLILEGEMCLGNLVLKSGDYHFAAKGAHHGRLYTNTGATVLLKGALPL